jgi:hypothetical protein
MYNKRILPTLLIFITALLPFYLFSPSNAAEATSLSVVCGPPENPQVLTGLEIGVSFTINITITNVTDLYGSQFALYYVSSILNATGYTEGSFLKQDGASTFFTEVDFTDNYNATHGRVFLALTRVTVAKGVNGTGTLAQITFKTKSYGNSPLHLEETKLIDSTEPFGKLISHEIIHGRVHVGLVDIGIINVQAPLNVPKGNLALINVTVENQGIITETFDVTLHYSGTAIATKPVPELPPAATQTLTFPWDTTPIPIGEYLLTATATIIPGEIDLEDNTYNAGLIYIGKRDIAITNTHPSKTVTNDTIVYINVTVTNNGETTAIFNLTAHRDTNPIETKTNINLAPGATVSLIFTLDTTPLPKGVYTISTTAQPVPGETNIADNTFVDGTITETILGDVTGDFKVDIIDIATIARAYGAYPGHPKWNPNADLDNNNKIDIIDIAKAAKNYGKEI